MVNLRFQTITGFSFNCFVLVLFQKFHRDDDDDEVTEAVQRASDNLGFTVKSIPNATHVTCSSNLLLIGKYVYGPFKSKRSIDCRLLTNTSWSASLPNLQPFTIYYCYYYDSRGNCWRCWFHRLLLSPWRSSRDYWHCRSSSRIHLQVSE